MVEYKFNLSFMKIYLGVIVLLTIWSSINTEQLTFLGGEEINKIDIDLENKFNSTEFISKNNFSRDLAIYYLYLASYGYCTLQEMSEGKCCTKLMKDENWTLIFVQKIDFFDYNFAILKNDIQKKVAITFPGTRSPDQFISEVFYSSGVNFKDEETKKVMDFFYRIYNLIDSLLSKALKEIILEYPNYQYIFTGHSLGGAMATILSYDLIKSKQIPVTEKSPVLITYGQPRTGNDVFSNEVMQLIPIVFRIMRQKDFIGSNPKCQTKFFKFDCLTVLPSSKFTPDLKLNSQQTELEKSNFYKWHIGGLKLFSEDMKTYVDCENEYGENHPDPNCHIKSSLNIKYHTRYFDQKVSKFCRLNQ